MNATLSLERFAVLLEAYGAAPHRWPEAERVAALRLLDTDTLAQQQWQQAQALDALLDALPAPQAPAANAVNAVLARLPPAPTSPTTNWAKALWLDLTGWRLAAPTFVLALVAGLATGLWLQPTATASTESTLDWWQLSQLEGSRWTQLADAP